VLTEVEAAFLCADPLGLKLVKNPNATTVLTAAAVVEPLAQLTKRQVILEPNEPLQSDAAAGHSAVNAIFVTHTVPSSLAVVIQSHLWNQLINVGDNDLKGIIEVDVAVQC